MRFANCIVFPPSPNGSHAMLLHERSAMASSAFVHLPAIIPVHLICFRVVAASNAAARDGHQIAGTAATVCENSLAPPTIIFSRDIVYDGRVTDRLLVVRIEDYEVRRAVYSIPWNPGQINRPSPMLVADCSQGCPDLCQVLCF
jgi:hypothetical protein